MGLIESLRYCDLKGKRLNNITDHIPMAPKYVDNDVLEWLIELLT